MFPYLVTCVCISKLGDYYGKGEERKRELLQACHVLGISSECVTIINDRFVVIIAAYSLIIEKLKILKIRGLIVNFFGRGNKLFYLIFVGTSAGGGKLLFVTQHIIQLM